MVAYLYSDEHLCLTVADLWSLVQLQFSRDLVRREFEMSVEEQLPSA